MASKHYQPHHVDAVKAALNTSGKVPFRGGTIEVFGSGRLLVKVEVKVNGVYGKFEAAFDDVEKAMDFLQELHDGTR